MGFIVYHFPGKKEGVEEVEGAANKESVANKESTNKESVANKGIATDSTNKVIVANKVGKNTNDVNGFHKSSKTNSDISSDIRSREFVAKLPRRENYWGMSSQMTSNAGDPFVTPPFQLFDRSGGLSEFWPAVEKMAEWEERGVSLHCPRILKQI
jgi:hypothetical protein